MPILSLERLTFDESVKKEPAEITAMIGKRYTGRLSGVVSSVRSMEVNDAGHVISAELLIQV